MTTITYDQVLALARRLPLVERLRLASVLTSAAAAEVPAMEVPVTADDLLGELDHLIAESAALGPAAQDSAAIISAMRR